MKEVTQYIRRTRNGRKNAKTGILYAQLDDEKIIKVGYSLCSKEDEFDSDKAAIIAKGRAELNRHNLLDSPPSIRKDIDGFIDRILRYFKDAEGSFTVYGVAGIIPEGISR